MKIVGISQSWLFKAKLVNGGRLGLRWRPAISRRKTPAAIPQFFFCYLIKTVIIYIVYDFVILVRTIRPGQAIYLYRTLNQAIKIS